MWGYCSWNKIFPYSSLTIKYAEKGFMEPYLNLLWCRIDMNNNEQVHTTWEMRVKYNFLVYFLMVCCADSRLPTKEVFKVMKIFGTSALNPGAGFLRNFTVAFDKFS